LKNLKLIELANLILGGPLDFTKVIDLDSKFLKNLITGGLSRVTNPSAEYLDFHPPKKAPKKQKTSPQVIQGEAAQLYFTTT